jgi:light-regulated signal transduction histidine kinase (bacteriophytochrome)
MSDLIDALLELSRINRSSLGRYRVDISQIAHAVVDEVRRRDVSRRLSAVIEPGLEANADGRLVRILFDNLIGNAWKFTGKTESPMVEVGMKRDDGEDVFFVRDNGAGFDMSYADRLFTPFQRLHSDREYAGTGIGLATCRRIIERHGGKIWAESSPGKGTTFFFTLPA